MGHINKYHALNKELDDLKEHLDLLEFDLDADSKRLIFYRNLRKKISLNMIGLFMFPIMQQ
ncbi:MAG: hypothetical protein ACTSRZ_05470 [Promethearchaeota archaeon]